MSSIKVEPFVFSDDEIQLNPETLPGAVEKQDKQEDKPVTKSADEDQEDEVIDDTQEVKEEDDFLDPLNILGKPAKKEKEEPVKQDKITTEEVDYKALKDFLIATEVWKDFEGSDEIEYNEETFKNLWKAQAENSVKEYLSEERANFGSAANQLIDYLKDGGTIEDFASNYSQQLDVASIDTSDEDGQERIIKEYYKSIDWPDNKIKKYLERLKDSGFEDFKEEAEDCKNKLVKAIEEERQLMLKEQEEIAKDRKLKIESFNRSVRNAIYKDADLADREKKELDKFVFDYKYKDDNGNKYSEFAVKMGEINSDPKKYQKFLRFVKDMDAFEKKSTTEKKEKKETFNFLKKGSSNPLEGAQSIQPTKNKQSSPPAFKFK